METRICHCNLGHGMKRWLGKAEKSPLKRLLADVVGATLPIGAAAILVLITLVGSAVDVSRGYLTQTSLQSACDAGVLAGRRAMSKSDTYEAAEIAKAQRMFDFNFSQQELGSNQTLFTSAATVDGEVAGTASTQLPPIMMQIFGFGEIGLSVNCSAELQLASADVMFVLDTTGSMNCDPGVNCFSSTEQTNAKIKGLRAGVADFHRTVAGAVQNKVETRIRYAFVPYSMTVNARDLLLNGSMPSSYIADTVNYQSRRALFNTAQYTPTTSPSSTTIVTYPSNITQGNCQTSSNNYGNNKFPSTAGTNPVNSGGPAPAATTVTTYSFNSWVKVSGKGSSALGTCKRNQQVATTTYTTVYRSNNTWRYIKTPLNAAPMKSFGNVSLVTAVATTATAPTAGYHDIQALASMAGTTGLTKTNFTWGGCLEERSTVNDIDMDPVPDQATDLDINSAPSSEETKWRPYFGAVEFFRNSSLVSLDSSTNLARAVEYCPSPMKLFQEIDTTDPTVVPAWLTTYLNGLRGTGGTYHDIGMIWGGRLSSPNGIFSDNVNSEPERSVSRHIIFMTDGDMAPETDFYSAYGLEKYDNKVAPSGTTRTNLIAYHNSRFVAACSAAKTEGYTIWVIGFGTTITPEMRACSSADRTYFSSNTTQLRATFRFIASQVADLRLNL